MGQTLPYSPSRPLALPLLLFTNCLVALLTTIIFLIMLILYIDLGVGVGIWGQRWRLFVFMIIFALRGSGRWPQRSDIRLLIRLELSLPTPEW